MNHPGLFSVVVLLVNLFTFGLIIWSDRKNKQVLIEAQEHLETAKKILEDSKKIQAVTRALYAAGSSDASPISHKSMDA